MPPLIPFFLVVRTLPTTLRTRWAFVTMVANVAIVHEKIRGNAACKCYNNVAQEMRKGVKGKMFYNKSNEQNREETVNKDCELIC